jgi:aspartate/methionine/tyrosine aminotransferase
VSRIDFTARENALSRALATRREPYVDLTVSNPTEAGLPPPDATLPAAPVYAPDPRGLPEAREAVARYHGVSAEQVILSASTSEAYSWLFKLLCDPGDEVLVPQPSYPLFEWLTALESVHAAPYELRWDGEWHIDSMPVTPKTRAILVVSPGNPTGAYLKKDEHQRLARLGIPLICDEVFADYPAFEDPRRVRTVAGRGDVLSFALSGLSKVAGLPQLKLGWMVASGSGSREMLRRLELIADTYLSVSTPVQLAAPRLLEARHGFQQALNCRLARNRAAVAPPPGAPWDVFRSEGGWSAVLSVPRSRSEEEWALALLDAGVLVHPGYFFDFTFGAHLVVSLLPEPAAFDRGVAILRSVLG